VTPELLTLFVIKPASSAIYNKYNSEMLRYFR